MLSIVYKLIFSKLLAVRLSLHIKELISPQKTGFILGRYILENILIEWLTHNWVIQYNKPTLFLRSQSQEESSKATHCLPSSLLSQCSP